MTLTLDDYMGLQLTKNLDDTYSGIKDIEFFDKKTNEILTGTAEFSKLKINWVKDIEFGIPKRIEILRQFNADGSLGEFWKMTISEN